MNQAMKKIIGIMSIIALGIAILIGLYFLITYTTKDYRIDLLQKNLESLEAERSLVISDIKFDEEAAVAMVNSLRWPKTESTSVQVPANSKYLFKMSDHNEYPSDDYKKILLNAIKSRSSESDIQVMKNAYILSKWLSSPKEKVSDCYDYVIIKVSAIMENESKLQKLDKEIEQIKYKIARSE